MSYSSDPENDNFANYAAEEFLDKLESGRATALLAEAERVVELNRNLSTPEQARANLDSYTALLAAAFPAAMWEYELSVTAEIRASMHTHRIAIRENTSQRIIMFCEIYVHSFMGRPHTEFLAVLPMTVKGERRSTVIPATERSVAEIARICIEESQLGLTRGLGTNEENDIRLAFLADRAEHALTMHEWSDRPEANLDRYYRRLADELPAAVRSIMPTLQSEVAAQLVKGIVIHKTGNHILEIRDAADQRLLFSLAVKIHEAYGSGKYLAVQVIDHDNQPGPNIDIRTKSADELAMEIVKNGIHVDSPADDVDFR